MGHSDYFKRNDIPTIKWTNPLNIGGFIISTLVTLVVSFEEEINFI